MHFFLFYSISIVVIVLYSGFSAVEDKFKELWIDFAELLHEGKSLALFKFDLR